MGDQKGALARLGIDNAEPGSKAQKPASKLRSTFSTCKQAQARLKSTTPTILAVIPDGSHTHPKSPLRAEDDGNGLSACSFPAEACR